MIRYGHILNLLECVLNYVEFSQFRKNLIFESKIFEFCKNIFSDEVGK